MIAIDDYGMGNDLKNYIKTIENDDIKVVMENKADQKYTACTEASLGARALRVIELEELDKKFALDKSTGKKIYPGSGSSSNIDTKNYLMLFRKQNRYSDFSLFVRKKWSNVELIDIEHPKNKRNSSFYSLYQKF